MTSISIESLTKDERSVLLYAECCMVDYGGLLEGERLNAADIEALAGFKNKGVLDFGRIPSKLLGTFVGRQSTHWVGDADTPGIKNHEPAVLAAIAKPKILKH